MTITSLDNFGHASGSISMSELRDYYGQSGAVSLNANFNGGTNPVPSSLPASGAETSFSNYRSKNRILKKKGRSYLYDTGTSWSPGESGCVQYNVYVIGGGGSGGAAFAGSGVEGPASGGGAGGTAFRRYSVQDDLTPVTSSFTQVQIVLTSGSTAAKVRFLVAPGDIVTGSLVAITNLTSQPSTFTSLGVDITILNDTSQTVTDADSSNNFVEVDLTLSSAAGGSTTLTGSASGSLTFNGASISFPTVAQAVSRTSSTSQISGYNGGDVTFNPTGTGATITGTGGFRGFGRFQGQASTTPTATTPVGEGDTTAGSGTGGVGSGQCAKGLGQTGSGGENNYKGGDGPALNIGGNQAGCTGGGSPNLSSGGVDGSTTSGQATGAPTEPSEFGSLWKINNVDASAPSFQGGNGLSTGGTAGSGNYGAGGGGSGSISSATTSGAGGAGALIVIHYEINT